MKQWFYQLRYILQLCTNSFHPYCKCSKIYYDKFSIDKDLNVIYYTEKNIKPDYIDDMAEIVLEVAKKFYFNNGSSN